MKEKSCTNCTHVMVCEEAKTLKRRLRDFVPNGITKEDFEKILEILYRYTYCPYFERR